MSITAEEARRLSGNIKNEELPVIYREIEFQSKLGKRKIFFNKRLSTSALDELRFNGFWVEEYEDQRDGYTATISW